jgi:hypothetical protein
MERVIIALKVVISDNKEFELSTYYDYQFTYSRTGNVKFTGKYKPKYFKKEVLNSCDSIELGHSTFFLFTEGFNIDENKCIKSLLHSLIYNSNLKIENLKKNLVFLENQLNKKRWT